MAELKGAGAMNWKPRVLRWPLLASFFLGICLLLSLLEFATHVLPPLSDKTATPHFDVISDNSTIIVDPGPARRSVAVPSPLPSRSRQSHDPLLVGRNSTNSTYYPMPNGTLATKNTSELHNGPDSYQDSSVRLTNVYWWWGVSNRDRFGEQAVVGPGEETAITPKNNNNKKTQKDKKEPKHHNTKDKPNGLVKSCRVQLMPKSKSCPTCQSVDGVRAYTGWDWQMSFLENDCLQRWIDDESSKLPPRRVP